MALQMQGQNWKINDSVWGVMEFGNDIGTIVKEIVDSLELQRLIGLGKLLKANTSL